MHITWIYIKCISADIGCCMIQWIIRVLTAQCQKPDWSGGLCTERECSQLAQHQQLTGIHWVSQLSDLTWPTGPSSQPAFPASHWSPACQHWPLIGQCQLTNTMSYVTLWQLRHQETQKTECHTHFQRHHSDLSAINYCKTTLFHWTTNVDWCGLETEFYNGHTQGGGYS